jgi:hypothetical protein
VRENQIYTSSKYDDFVLRNANRDIDESHVKRIAENMAENGWQGSPIEVSETEDGKFQIEDGQHRYMAAKKAGIPVNFMVVKPKTIFEIALMNSMKKGWRGSDYIKAYAEDGNYNYKRLKNLEEEFPNISLTDILYVVGSNMGNGTGTRKNLQKGYVRITDEQFYMAREVLKTLQILNEDIDSLGIKTKSNYKRELILLLKHNIIDPQRMIDKMDKHGKMLLPLSATRPQALEHLEVLYNYHQPKSTIVFFKEKLRSA